MNKLNEVNERLAAVNEVLKQTGMLRIKAVDPKKLKGQRVNARYMNAETMHQLTENIKRMGRMESLPLTYEEDGEDKIISGHHRVEAAKAAGLEYILVLVDEPEGRDDVVSKQLAHNALTGQDDLQILERLFSEIKDVEKRIATGLSDAAGKVSYTSLNFRTGNFKEFVVAFLPEDVGIFDEAMEAIAKDMLSRQDAELRLTSMAYYEQFTKAMIKVKKYENIKSNGVALMRLVELAMEMMQQKLEEQSLTDAPFIVMSCDSKTEKDAGKD